MKKPILLFSAALFLLVSLRASPGNAQVLIEPYARVLQEFVDASGNVDYRGLKANRKNLDEYLEYIAVVDRETFNLWPTNEKKAFWVNAYNALTLKVIIDHYPIQPDWKKKLLHPENSIQQIPGAWNGLKHRVMNRMITLDDIENKVLRKLYPGADIHLALVCASKSCPPLRRTPYTGTDWEKQVDQQAGIFFNDPQRFFVDRAGGVVHLSKLFSWYPQDFLDYRQDRFARFTPAVNAALGYAYAYLRPELQAVLDRGEFKTDYLAYDWSLNEQAEKK